MVSSINSTSMLTEVLSGLKQNQKKPDSNELFSNIDANGDGVISAEELEEFQSSNTESTGPAAELNKALAAMDSDGDGTITKDEFNTGMQKFEEDMKAKAGSMAPPPPPPSEEEMFSSIDEDDDGSITTEQLTDFLTEMSEKTGKDINVSQTVEKFDTNGDGKVSADEFIAGMKELREEMKPQGEDETASKVGLYAQNSDLKEEASLLDIEV